MIRLNMTHVNKGATALCHSTCRYQRLMFEVECVTLINYLTFWLPGYTIISSPPPCPVPLSSCMHQRRVLSVFLYFQRERPFQVLYGGLSFEDPLERMRFNRPSRGPLTISYHGI